MGQSDFKIDEWTQQPWAVSDETGQAKNTDSSMNGGLPARVYRSVQSHFRMTAQLVPLRWIRVSELVRGHHIQILASSGS